ncbi:MAG: hypothetical protein AAF378_18150 [Cyanobacteria bacterium P01_A01_bin.84]
MKYAFDIVGVSPILNFFNHQQQCIDDGKNQGLEYLGTQTFTLDTLIENVEPLTPKWGWDKDEVVGTVINFWMNNSDSIRYWKSRLDDAGRDNLLVTRVAEMKALQAEFESLINLNS